MYADLWLFSAFDRNTHQFDSAFTTLLTYWTAEGGDRGCLRFRQCVEVEHLIRPDHPSFPKTPFGSLVKRHP